MPLSRIYNERMLTSSSRVDFDSTFASLDPKAQKLFCYMPNLHKNFFRENPEYLLMILPSSAQLFSRLHNQENGEALTPNLFSAEFAYILADTNLTPEKHRQIVNVLADLAKLKPAAMVNIMGE